MMRRRGIGTLRFDDDIVKKNNGVNKRFEGNTLVWSTCDGVSTGRDNTLFQSKERCLGSLEATF